MEYLEKRIKELQNKAWDAASILDFDLALKYQFIVNELYDVKHELMKEKINESILRLNNETFK